MEHATSPGTYTGHCSSADFTLYDVQHEREQSKPSRIQSQGP